jgi:hypothetical protein
MIRRREMQRDLTLILMNEDKPPIAKIAAKANVIELRLSAELAGLAMMSMICSG